MYAKPDLFQAYGAATPAAIVGNGARHAGMQLESYERGLRFAFAPLAPESGPVAGR